MPKLNKLDTQVKSAKVSAGAKSPGLEQLNKIIDNLRPALERDGGNLELISYDEQRGIVEVTFSGACAHCPVSDVTLKHLIEAEIKAQLPSVREVRSI